MCRHQLHVGWDGTLYDCDFNFALGLPVNPVTPGHISRHIPPNGNGVRTTEIDAGVDPQLTPLRWFAYLGPHVSLGFPPGIVPRDPVDGHPLRYQMLSDGTFLLYSIGSDNVDNGGDPTATPGSKSFGWQHSRDWVWARPATSKEIEFFRANPPK